MEGIDAFISIVAAAEPLPGGGSTAALAGALAAALGQMMAGLTEGREKFVSVQPQVREIHARLADLRTVFQALIQEDSTAYKALLNSLRLPRETETQRAARADAIEKTTRGATETPLSTARAAVEVLKNLKILIEIGNPHARSDVAVGCQLAYAALKAGQYNTLANIRGLRDTSFADGCRSEITNLVVRGHKILREVDRQMTGG